MSRRLWRAYVRVGALKERTLRALSPSRMQFVHYGWPLRPTVCPCDLDFCDFLRERAIGNKAIFHLGPGNHHIVGLRNHAAPMPNDVFALTLSPLEHANYATRVIHDPALAKHYKVMFADIYSLNAGCLPRFDVIALFHLGEFGDAHSPARRMDDAGVLELFFATAAPGAKILLYRGSYGHASLQPLIAQAVAGGRMTRVESYKSLDVFEIAASP